MHVFNGGTFYIFNVVLNKRRLGIYIILSF